VKALSPSPRKKEITRKIDYMVHGNWSVMLWVTPAELLCWQWPLEGCQGPAGCLTSSAHRAEWGQPHPPHPHHTKYCTDELGSQGSPTPTPAHCFWVFPVTMWIKLQAPPPSFLWNNTILL
jgi:hypothetical protein